MTQQNINNAILLQNATLEDLEKMVKRAVAEQMSAVSVKQPKEVEKKGLPKYVKRIETARILGVTVPTLDDWTRNGLIQCCRISNRVYYSEEEIARALGDKQTLS